MANNNVREIKTRLSLDGETAFRKSLKSVDSSLTAMQSELKKVSAGFDDSTSSMEKNRQKSAVLQKIQDQLKVKVGALSDAVETSAKAYEEAKKKAEDLTAEFGDQSNEAKIAWAEVETLGNKLDRMTTMCNNAETKLKGVTKQLDEVGQTETFIGKVKSAIQDMDSAATDASGGGFTVLKGAASNLVSEGLGLVYDKVKDIVTEFGGLDSVYNNFAAKTGTALSDMSEYEDAIMGLYKDGYGESLDGISESMAKIKQSMGDVSTDALKEATQYALTFEKTFGYDTSESMRAASSMVDQFGVSYSQAYSLMIQGAQNGLDQNGDLLDVINEYSVQFANSGYSAENMFNMLQNGTEQGVWSVDKLGDAWKEFNIRLTDGTADEALHSLGFGFEEVNAETGETTINLDEIKTKLSAGGDAAQTARNRIIGALMDVEDENARYLLGQQLMGTMWEDLGEDAVTAMFNTQGGITDTKNSMQELIDLSYDDVGTKLETLGRTAKAEIAEPLLEEALPKIEEGIEWVSENLDELIPVVQKVGGAIVAAFVVKKVIDFGTSVGTVLKGAINVVKGLTTATTAQTAAQTALNATNPFGWAVIAVGAIGGLTAALALNTETMADVYEAGKELTGAQQDIAEATDASIEKWNDWKEARDNATSGTDAEFQYYDDLWTELQKIVDQNGNIKKGYEDRAEYITTKLSEVTDEEIKIVDGAVQKYGELKTSIEDVLKIKKAESYMSAYQGAFDEAVAGEAQLQEDIMNAEDLLTEIRGEVADAQKAQTEAWQKMSEAKTAFEKSGGNASLVAYDNAVLEYQKSVTFAEGVRDKYHEQEEALAELESQYADTRATIENYHDLEAAIVNEDAEAIEDTLLKNKYNFKDATTATKEQLFEQTEALGKTLLDMRDRLRRGMPGVTMESVKQMEYLVMMSKDELSKAGGEWYGETYEATLSAAQGVTDGTPEMVAASENAASEAGTAMGNTAEKKAREAAARAAAAYSNAMRELSSSLGVDVDVQNGTMSDIVAAVKNKYPQFANGVNNFAGGFAYINENDKGELVNLPNGSQVIPHDISLRYAEEAARSGNTVNTFGNINITVNASSLASNQDIKGVAVKLSEQTISEIARRIDGQKQRNSKAIGR